VTVLNFDEAEYKVKFMNLVGIEVLTAVAMESCYLLGYNAV
jgi:hypothetical protein